MVNNQKINLYNFVQHWDHLFSDKKVFDLTLASETQ